MKKISSLPSSRHFLNLSALVLLLPAVAHAHTGAGPASGFMSGFAHPLNGLDHMLAMIAVGIWAAQLGGRATWAVPLSFVSVMALGGLFGIMGVSLPLVEQGILLSVLVLGVLVAAAARLPLVASMAIVGLFALCHGHAHGAELPHGASGLSYGLGFVLATSLLHVFGIGLGLLTQKSLKPQVVRLAGAAIAAGGLYLGVVSVM